MEKLVYKYKDFNIENHSITFDTDGDGVLISIPFMDSTPDILKNKLDELINWQLEEWLSNNIIEGCMPTAENLLLNARMLINYCYGKEPKYYIDAIITDLYSEIGMDVWVKGTCDIQSEVSELRNEFITYCRNELDKVLFSDCGINLER